MAKKERVSGETTFGSTRQQSTLAVNSKALTAPGIVLIDTAGVEYVLWISSAGKLTIGTRTQFKTPNTAGTIVGTQS